MCKNKYDKDNPFYDNHIFKKYDIERNIIKWWQLPLVWPFLTTYVQINEGHVFHYKTYKGRYYFIKAEPLNWPRKNT